MLFISLWSFQVNNIELKQPAAAPKPLVNNNLQGHSCRCIDNSAYI